MKRWLPIVAILTMSCNGYSTSPIKAVVIAASDEHKGLILIATCPKGYSPKPLSYVHVAFGDMEYIDKVDSILHATCER